jgi:hypothetical protein
MCCKKTGVICDKQICEGNVIGILRNLKLKLNRKGPLHYRGTGIQKSKMAAEKSYSVDLP